MQEDERRGNSGLHKNATLQITGRALVGARPRIRGARTPLFPDSVSPSELASPKTASCMTDLFPTATAETPTCPFSRQVYGDKSATMLEFVIAKSDAWNGSTPNEDPRFPEVEMKMWIHPDSSPQKVHKA